MEIPIWLRVLESLAAIVTPLLIAIGGFFAWYKFIRQGEHDPRLQPSVASEVTIKDNVAFIIATVSVQNNGQVDVKLERESCALILLCREARSGWSTSEAWYEVFLGQNAVQPDELVEDEIWIERELNDDVALCLELAISEEGGKAWRTYEIISLVDGGQTPSGG